MQRSEAGAGESGQAGRLQAGMHLAEQDWRHSEAACKRLREPGRR